MSERDEGFRKELACLINRYSRENGSDTPDFILADYLDGCLRVFAGVLQRRETWYGRKSPFPTKVGALASPAAAPAAETGANEIGYCKTCGLDASHGVCNDPRDARIAELEAALRELTRAATEHANAHGCSGDLGARLSDAKALLAVGTSARGAGEGT